MRFKNQTRTSENGGAGQRARKSPWGIHAGSRLAVEERSGGEPFPRVCLTWSENYHFRHKLAPAGRKPPEVVRKTP